jgi:tetratricopeptide (TPR) repeat protein
MKTEAGHLYRDWEAKNSILVTWQMSFDHIRQTKPSAADLLSLMSFFDRQGIPEGLVRLQPESNRRSTPELLNDSTAGDTSEYDVCFDFEDDIMTLRNYSFISISENGSLFMMHRLVQLTTLAWLESHGQMDQWKEIFINNLYREFPTGEYENWVKCQSLFPHVRLAMFQRPLSQEYLLRWATLLYRGAWYASECGNIADAREMASKSRDQRVILLGQNHGDVVYSTIMLAKAYWLEGQWEAAEQLLVRVIETCNTKVCEVHPSILWAMTNLASIYRNQGRWEEAMQLSVKVIETSKATFGEDHPSTLMTMVNIASTYWDLGRLEEAEQLEVQVMQARKMQLGEDHPDTLTSMANLASTYRNQG